MAAAARTRISTDVDFEKDGRQTGFLRLPYSVHRSAYGWLPIPVVCIRNGDGPKVLLSAGNHGDEYEGQVIMTRLCRELEADDIRGRVIIMPALNAPAARAGRRTSPLEEGEAGNLNRSFPGDPDGSPTQMIAHYVESVLLAGSDYVFDLHSGGSSLMILPSALMKRSEDDARTARTIELLKVFGAPISFIDLDDSDRPISGAARRQGTIHVGTELGGGGTVSPRALEIGDKGLKRALRHIGSLDGDRYQVDDAPPTRLVTVGGPDYYVHAADDGLFEPLVDLGDDVEAGQPAAAVHVPETPWREPVIAHFERDGMVLCRRHPGRTERGDCLFHLCTDYEE